MTLGQYPAGVPAKLLIAPDVFKSEFEIKRFHEIAGGLGLDLNRISGGTIIEDFDNDGLLDIITSSIHSREPLRCFHNDGNGTFTDVTQKAGLEGETGGLNIMQTDYDNDGWADVLVLRGAWYEKNGHWPLSLLHNNGNGTFTDVTEKAGLLRFHPTQTAVWFDYNGDGKLDLFVGNESRGADVNPSELFHNNGDGTFTEVARDCGLAFTEFVKGAVSADYNNDGRPDLFLSVMGGPNRLLRNDGPGPGGKTWKFTDVSKEAGVDNPGMSFSCFFFDYDNDGWEDLFVTSYDYRNLDVGEQAKDYLGMNVDRDYPCLYHNNRNGTFTNVWPRSRGRLLWGMGINFGDMDGDGWLDFYVGTGNPALEFLSPNRMFRNNGGKSFQDVTTSGGLASPEGPRDLFRRPEQRRRAGHLREHGRPLRRRHSLQRPLRKPRIWQPLALSQAGRRAEQPRRNRRQDQSGSKRGRQTAGDPPNRRHRRQLRRQSIPTGDRPGQSVIHRACGDYVASHRQDSDRSQPPARLLL